MKRADHEHDRKRQAGSSTQTPLRRLFPSWPPEGFRMVFSGELGPITVTDVISLLNHGRHSGLLVTVTAGIERGFAFSDGDVVWARSQKEEEGSEPGEALRGLLGGPEGTFSFLRGPVDSASAGERIPTLQLVLDTVRRLDEAARKPRS